MPTAPKVLGFAGSLRSASFNKKLVRIALEGAKAAGAEVTFLDLRELDLPVFDEDLEAKVTLPLGAKRLKELLRAHDAMLIACPEYNSSITAALKNAIDWASRPEPGQPPLAGFSDKVAVLMSASPGALGGLRGLVHARAILSSINVIVLPQQVAVSKAHEAFDESGRLKDAKQHASIAALGALAAKTASKLRA